MLEDVVEPEGVPVLWVVRVLMVRLVEPVEREPVERQMVGNVGREGSVSRQLRGAVAVALVVAARGVLPQRLCGARATA